jgi:hypothetical protein
MIRHHSLTIATMMDYYRYCSATYYIKGDTVELHHHDDGA